MPYDSYSRQRQTLADIGAGVQSGAIQNVAPQAQFGPQPQLTNFSSLPLNDPRWAGQRGGYFVNGQYRTGLMSNPQVMAGLSTIRQGQDAMRASGGFNVPPGFNPNVGSGWLPGEGDAGMPYSSGGVPQNPTQPVMPSLNNSVNQYNSQYTGFGGSNLSATGNPDYNGSGGGSNTNGSSGPTSSRTPYYYSGMPQSNTRPTVMQQAPTSTTYPAPVAPLLRR
jgi:hypothetical protein